MTIPQMLRDRFLKWKSNRCMMVKEDGVYKDVSWNEFYGQVEAVAKALISRGFKKGDRAAVLSGTSREWAIADAAILSAGGVSVPIYPSLTPAGVADLVERSRPKAIFVSDAEQLEKCFSLLDKIEGLDLLALFDPKAMNGSDRVVTLAALAAEGAVRDSALLEERIDQGAEDDAATIIFTSGTTGEPKGVTLTHKNIMSNIEACLELFNIGPSDICLAHLPLSHILERMAGYYLMLWSGAAIAYAEELSTVGQNMTEVRPTAVVSVPRIFEKIYAGLQAKAAESSTLKKMLMLWAIDLANRIGELQAEGKDLPPGLQLRKALADPLVYSKVRAKFGGRIRFFIAGGAKLAPELARFFGAVGINVFEGYGLTETSPVIAVNTPKHHKIGSVGKPLSNVEVRIAADGEILVKGPSVFAGYFENEAASKRAFNDDGFFRTGDIGRIDSEGYLFITDRKKDLIVTAGGKNVAPQKIENILKLDKYISEAMLYGEGKRFISAIIVPDFSWLQRHAQEAGIAAALIYDLVKDERIIRFFEKRLEVLQEQAHLASYEKVKKFILLDHEFTIEDGEATPTMKVRRNAVAQKYKNKLEALYEE